jgi:hypothetical protein
MSPRTIITGKTVDYNRHCKHAFGQYVQTHEQHDNSMGPQTIGALATRPTRNAQGNFYYFSLSTGRIINRTNATALPMPDDVIEQVHKLARRQKANRGLIYADRNQVVNNDDEDESDDDESYHPDMDAKSDDKPDHNSDSDADDSDYDPSSSKRTRHMNIRYFFVKDRVASKELSIEHCPTEDMVADYFTKPLQGKLFYKLRDLVMNIGPSSKYSSAQRSVLRNGDTRKSDRDSSSK